MRRKESESIAERNSPVIEQAVTKVAEEKCASLGISYPQFLVLFSLQFCAGPTRIVDLARHLNKQTNSVSMIVDRMVKQRLIRRVKSTRDRRIVLLKITDYGTEKVKHAIGPLWEVWEMMTGVFSDDELREFSDFLAKFKQHLYKLAMVSETVRRELVFYDIRKIANAIGITRYAP